MKKHFVNIRKAVKCNCGVRGKEASLFIFLCFIIGLFLGSMASSPIFRNTFYNNHSLRLLTDIGSVFLILFLSTSFLGYLIIPPLVALRGFIFSAVLSSAISATSTGIIFLLLSEAISAFMYLPCLFILASEGFSVSRNMSSRKYYGFCKANSSFVKHIIFCIPLCVAEILYITYLLPHFCI